MSERYKRFLDASLVPLEKALLARAGALQAEADEGTEQPGRSIPAAGMLAAEFRALAEELHRQ